MNGVILFLLYTQIDFIIKSKQIELEVKIFKKPLNFLSDFIKVSYNKDEWSNTFSFIHIYIYIYYIFF